MNLHTVLRTECLATGVSAESKAEALRLVARTARKSPLLAEAGEEAILKGLEERESVGSTGFGGGIAIPHCRLKAASDFVVGVLTFPDGVDFETLDRKPVRLMVFIIAPEKESNEHVQILAAVSQVLRQPGAVDEMIGARSNEALLESFLRRAKDEVAPATRERVLFHVFVQSDDEFRGILQVFAGIDGTSALVVEAQNCHVYLASMPLFAGFWRDEETAYGRIIIASVDKRLANETMRRIEQETGDLDARSGVMVTIQNLYFSAGSLKA